MTITVYGPAYSTCVMRVLAALYEKNVEDFELHPVDLMKGEQKKPEILAMHPFGKVPILKDGELVLFESRAIARFIAHKFEGQGTTLYGKTPKDKALVEQWIEVESQNFNGPASAVVFEISFGPIMRGTTTDEKVLAAELAKLEKVLDVYEKHLSKSKYLAGDFFSLADLCHLPYLHYLIHAAKKGEVVESRPAVKAWWEDISSRPVWKKVAEAATQAAGPPKK